MEAFGKKTSNKSLYSIFAHFLFSTLLIFFSPLLLILASLSTDAIIRGLGGWASPRHSQWQTFESLCYPRDHPSKLFLLNMSGSN